jgi:DNA uptake protein ComE-like DNA-binding protein
MAIVLWFLAAMSLLVSGIVYEARADIKLAQAHSARAKATASGDGAVHLTMASLMSNKSEQIAGEDILSARFVVGRQSVDVELVPLAGLIDLNTASRQTLQVLFEVSAGIAAGDAQRLANNVVIWRRDKLHSAEDLLRVEGATRAILDSIRDSVYAGSARGVKLDLKAAPESVLRVVAKQNPDRVAAMQAQKAAAGNGGQQKRRSRGNFRADARVTLGDKVWLRRVWVSTEDASEGSLPWSISRSEAARVQVAG